MTGRRLASVLAAALCAACLVAAAVAWAQTAVELSAGRPPASIDDSRHLAGVPAFSESERAWMRAKGEVRYSIDPSWAPVEYVRDDQPQGLVVQYLRHFEQVMPLRFEFVPTPDWRAAVQQFDAGQLDLVTDSSLRSADPAVAPRGLYTLPFYAGNTMVAALPEHPVVLEVNQLAGLRVAIGRDEAVGGWLRETMPDLDLRPYDTPAAMLDAIVRRDVDVAVAPELVLLPLMLRTYRGEVAVAGTLVEMPVVQRLIVPANLPDLKVVLDKAILSMTAGDTDRMLATWVDRVDFGRPSLRTVFAYYRSEIALGVLLVVFLLTTLALVWRMRRATQRNAERKMAYLAMISHEIRTAMNALTGPLELLGRKPTEAQRATLLQVAQGGARALVETVNDFLDMSTLQARKARVLALPVDVPVLVQEVVRALRYTVPVDVQLTHATTVGATVMLDAGKYRQILNNLLANAIKFTPAGRIAVEVRWHDGWLHTEVCDTGIGMTPQQARAIFDAYVQGEAAIASTQRGTGLGLAICKGLVDLMGGRLDVVTQPEQGTTFTVDLPAEAVSHQSMPRLAGQDGGMPPLSMRRLVLAVDDSPVNLVVLRNQFQALDWPLATSASGNDALTRWRAQPCAVLLLDCHMPDVSGYDVARCIRAEEAARGGRRTALVAVSAHADPVHAALCRASGMDDVLVKPLKLADLQRVLLKYAVAPASEAAPGDDTEAGQAQIRAMMCQANAADGAGMRQALLQRDAVALARLAHRVHGAALVVGAAALARAVLVVQKHARAEPPDWAALDAAVAAALAAMDDYAGDATADAP